MKYEGTTGGLRRAGPAGCAGCPRLNARLSLETRSTRKQTQPAGPARRRPPGRLSRLAGLLLLATTTAFADVERTITPGAAGPNRLEVDVSLLSHAAADLRDLRLHDAQKREIGYLLVPPDNKPEWLDGRILPVAATKKTSGFELDLGHTTRADRLRFDGIAAPFLKRVRIEGSGDRARWTLLADATVFDLPDERLRLLEVPFAAGDFRYLRATWDDRSSAPVQTGRASARRHDTGTPPEPLRASVPFRKRASEPGKSRYRLTLPGPHLPLDAIELRVANGNVFRSATVTEPRLGNGEVLPVALGTGTLRRAERWGAVAEEMAVRIEHPSERELDLVIEDANNPPLAITAAIARFAPQPSIYFEAPSTTPLTARYGNPRLAAPAYDLEASRRYLDRAATAVAKWEPTSQEITPSPSATDTVAALQGAPVDRGAFRVARPLPKAPAGLTVLLLDADVHARSRELADVRIVTANDTQVPYLVEKRDEPLVLTLTPRKVESSRGTTIYRLEIPYASLPMDSYIVLKTTARVFERHVTLRSAANERRGRTPSDLHNITWRATDPELLPPALTFHAPLTIGEALEVVV
ncbi:MAG TPA: DUF3999 family protein, partial [Solirubrobacterales bacterium]|nr:DUF3999 family protein [Solirubrobacterales bacterium]